MNKKDMEKMIRACVAYIDDLTMLMLMLMLMLSLLHCRYPQYCPDLSRTPSPNRPFSQYIVFGGMGVDITVANVGSCYNW